MSDSVITVFPGKRAPHAALDALPEPKHAFGLAALPTLLLSLTPGIGFAIGLAALAEVPRFAFLASLRTWPWQLFAMGAFGTAATVAGAIDWTYHRIAGITIGPRERRAELLALGLGGVPLFCVMVAASLAHDPRPYLVPVFVLLVATTAMIAYDEVSFHARRCAPAEDLLHRTLTFGHLTAFLAWAHLVFVAGIPHV